MYTNFIIILKDNNDKTIYEEHALCKNNNDYYSFNSDNVITTFNLKENFMYRRESLDNILDISINDGIISSKLFLKELNDYINLEIKMISFELTKDKLRLEYVMNEEHKSLEIIKEQ